MNLLVFIDESGTSDLEHIPADFPALCLCLVFIPSDDYASAIVPPLVSFKLQHWKREDVILHSTAIRNGTGDFAFLQKRPPAERAAFLDSLFTLFAPLPFTLRPIVIRKDWHKDRYGEDANDPYWLAAMFALERICEHAEKLGYKDISVVIEKREKRQNQDIQERLDIFLARGSSFYDAGNIERGIRRERYQALKWQIVFVDKKSNSYGLQIADLCAWPIAKHFADPTKPFRPYEQIAAKIIRPFVFPWRKEP